MAKTEAELLTAYEPRVAHTTTYERQIWQARFSPCGEYLYGAGYDARIPRWKFNPAAGESEMTLEPLEPLDGHHGWLQCLGFSGSSERLLTADSWGKLTCWIYRQEKPEAAWSHESAHDGWIRALHASPDGQHVATGGNDSELRIWKIADGAQVAAIPHDHRILSVQWHPDGKSVFTGDLEGMVRRWAFPTVEDAKPIQTYDAQALYQLHRIQHCGGVRCLSLDRDGKQLLVAGQKTPEGGFATGTPCALLFDVESAKLTREMPVGGTSDGFMYDVRFHPDGFVMGASSAFPKKGHLWFWMPDSEKPFYSKNELSNGRSLEMHPSGSCVAMVISDSPNANGRPLNDGEYQGGSAKVHLLRLGEFI